MQVAQPMPPISFARGAPSLECLDPELIADCAEAALERGRPHDPRVRPAAATALCARCSPNGTGSPRGASSSPPRAAGFRALPAVQLAPARPGARRGPSYDRPLKLLRLQAWRPSPCRWTTRAWTSTPSRWSSTVAGRSPSSTASRPFRTRAAGRSAWSAGAVWRRWSPSVGSTCSRTTRTEPSGTRRRAPAVAPRARGRRPRRVHFVILEDGRPGAPRGVVRRPRRARGPL